MSALFVDSFDHYASASMDMKWDALGPSGWSIGPYGRWGSNAFHCSGGNGYARKGVNLDAQLIIVGFAMKPNVTESQFAFFETYSAVIDDRPMIIFSRNTDGSISAWRAADATGSSGSMSLAGCTLLGSTPTGLIGNGVWNYVEFKIDHDNAGGTIDVAVNGNTELTLAAIDTRSSDRICTSFGIGLSASIGTLDFDDLYCADDSGTGVTDFQGDSRIEVIYPESEGANLAWTPNTGTAHWSLVDETVPDDDTTYVSTTAVGNKDSYNYQPVVGSGDIIAVQVNMIARKEASGTKKLKALVRNTATNYLSTEEHAISMDYKDYRAVFEENPNTSAAWTPAEVNASEFGQEVTL